MGVVKELLAYDYESSRPVVEPVAVVAQKAASKARKAARRASWLRGPGGYLDIWRQYGFFSKLTSVSRVSTTESDFLSGMERCMSGWFSEKLGEQTRYRGIGCGERRFEPGCTEYERKAESQVAAQEIRLLNETVESRGVELQSRGLKLVLTLPDFMSEKLDGLLWTEPKEWSRRVGSVGRRAAELVREHFGPGVGFVSGWHFLGEGNPGKPHYHLNLLVLPWSRVGEELRALPRWVTVEALAMLRRAWAKELLSEWLGWIRAGGIPWGMSVGAWRKYRAQVVAGFPVECDLWTSYCKTDAQVYHFARYLYHSQLHDLWQGWKGVNAAGVVYRHKENDGRRTEIMLPVSDVERAILRVDRLPRKFQAIQWWGIMANASKGGIMQDMGFERVPKSGGEKWERTGTYRFVRYEPGGVVLRSMSGENRGELVHVLDQQIDFRPSGLKLRGARWRLSVGGQGSGPDLGVDLDSVDGAIRELRGRRKGV